MSILFLLADEGLDFFYLKSKNDKKIKRTSFHRVIVLIDKVGVRLPLLQKSGNALLKLLCACRTARSLLVVIVDTTAEGVVASLVSMM